MSSHNFSFSFGGAMKLVLAVFLLFFCEHLITMASFGHQNSWKLEAIGFSWNSFLGLKPTWNKRTQTPRNRHLPGVQRINHQPGGRQLSWNIRDFGIACLCSMNMNHNKLASVFSFVCCGGTWAGTCLSSSLCRLTHVLVGFLIFFSFLVRFSSFIFVN